jgi:hypothetical protein
VLLAAAVGETPVGLPDRLALAADLLRRQPDATIGTVAGRSGTARADLGPSRAAPG